MTRPAFLGRSEPAVIGSPAGLLLPLHNERSQWVDMMDHNTRRRGTGNGSGWSWRSVALVTMLTLLVFTEAPVFEGFGATDPLPSSRTSLPGNLARAKVYLAAGDYRRALEACQQEVHERPSAASYTYLTYVYHAIDGYLEQLATDDEWGAVERLFWNLAYRDAQDLVDPPGGLARMAKEMIQTSVRHQADVHAAMAARLDRRTTDSIWLEQKAWRQAEPERWWAGVPVEWRW